MKYPRSEKQRLAWIINFINQNIESIGDGDFLKLISEMGLNIKSLSALPWLHGTIKEWGKDPAILDMLEKVGLHLESFDLRKQVQGFQSQLRTFLEKILNSKDSSQPEVITNYHGPAESVFVQADKINILPSAQDEIPLEYELSKLIYECSPESDSAGWKSLNYIKRCQAPKGRKGERCQNFFLQLHKTEKNFCSTKCAWRAYSAARRQEGKRPKIGRSR